MERFREIRLYLELEGVDYCIIAINNHILNNMQTVWYIGNNYIDQHRVGR